MKRQVEAVRRLREEREALQTEQRRLDDQVKVLMENLGVVERENRTLREEIKELKGKVRTQGEQEEERAESGWNDRNTLEG